jgi:hypothetical protein
VYTILSFAALAFIIAVVPETKGFSLEQIEADLNKRAAERQVLTVGNPAE